LKPFDACLFLSERVVCRHGESGLRSPDTSFTTVVILKLAGKQAARAKASACDVPFAGS
jgi:hypothetical protein